MNMFKKFGSEYLIPISTILIAIILYFVTKDNEPKERSRIENLYQVGKYTLGTVNGRTYSGGSWDINNILYEYYVGGKKYKSDNNINSRTVLTDHGKENWYKHSKKGNQYMVVYDPNDPQNSFLILDHRIKDPSDYEYYLDLLENKKE